MKPPHLFDEDVDWKVLANESAPVIRKTLDDVLSILTCYGQEFCDERGLLMNNVEMDDKARAEHLMAVSAHYKQVAGESSGAITPDMTPNLFTRDIIREPTTNYEPDLSFLDWVYQRKMKSNSESRSTWEADLEFVRIDQFGMAKYGKFIDGQRSMVSYEYGAGINIKTSWFEMNTFGIEMESLAPKFRFAYFDELMSTAVYAALVAGITTAATITQNVIRDINNAMAAMRRVPNSFGKFPWSNARFRIIAPPEAAWWLDGAYAMSYGLLSRERLLTRPAITYTTKLPAGNVIYLIIDNWEQNELGTRVPFGVYGRTNDIDTFSEKMTYRGDWGFQMDAASGRILTFDPSHASFVIGGPIGTRDI